MKMIVAIISIVCFNDLIMHANEKDQGILQTNRSDWREPVQAQDHGGAADQDAGRKGKKENAEALIGRTYNRLTILGICGRTNRGNVKVRCLCVCGNETEAVAAAVKYGSTKSCGCLSRDVAMIGRGKTNAKPRGEPIYHEDGSISIPLTQGKFTRIDAEDFVKVTERIWCVSVVGYAVRCENRKAVLLHRMLMSDPLGMEVDHINLDKLDNRKENLRVATRPQNGSNTGIPSTNTSGYKGVVWRQDCGKWLAQIKVNKKGIYLGLFTDVLDASNAYKEAALKYFGDFARLA